MLFIYSVNAHIPGTLCSLPQYKASWTSEGNSLSLIYFEFAMIVELVVC